MLEVLNWERRDHTHNATHKRLLSDTTVGSMSVVCYTRSMSVVCHTRSMSVVCYTRSMSVVCHTCSYANKAFVQHLGISVRDEYLNILIVYTQRWGNES